MPTTKLMRTGNSTAVTLSRDVLQRAGLARGDDVQVEAQEGRVIITKVDSDHARTLDSGRRFMSRYPKTMAALAK